MKFLIGIILSTNLLLASIDLNTASEKDLITLHGIGLKKAQSIVVFRKNNCFKNVEALAKVKGIGTKTIEKNRKIITVSDCK